MAVIDLDAEATQTGFARLVGVSQQAISKQIEKGNLTAGGNNLQWLHEYCDQLRQQAAGRGGDDQMNVAQATVAEKTMKTALHRLEYGEKLGNLILKEEALELLSDWAGYAARQIRQSFERYTSDVESELDIAVPVELSEKYAGTAIERVRGFALKLGGDSSESGGVSEASNEDKH